MSNMRKIYVVGSGNLAVHCAGYAKDKGMEVFLFEMAEKKSMFVEARAAKFGIAYFHEKKENVFQRILEETEECLLISAINEFIIPAEILEKNNVVAVNLHQALLPKHPGRNAECWAIYEQDKVSGITWHYMKKQVDAGDIILQKEIKLTDNMTAYQLFQKQIEVAGEAFEEIFDDLINGKIVGKPQIKDKTVKLHKSWEVPNEGYLDLGWSGEKRSAFLRAMDYSVLNVMEAPKLLYQNKVYRWKKYEINRTDSMEEKIMVDEQNIQLQKDGILITLKKYKLEEH